MVHPVAMAVATARRQRTAGGESRPISTVETQRKAEYHAVTDSHRALEGNGDPVNRSELGPPLLARLGPGKRAAAAAARPRAHGRR